MMYVCFQLIIAILQQHIITDVNLTAQLIFGSVSLNIHEHQTRKHHYCRYYYCPCGPYVYSAALD